MLVSFFKTFFLLQSILILFLSAQSQAPTNTVSSSLMPDFSSLASSIESFGTGIIQSFGYCPANYTYTMMVLNDTPQQLLVALQKFINVQGELFPGTTAQHALIQPFSITDQSDFLNVNICHARVYLDGGGDQSVPWWNIAGQDINKLLSFGLNSSFIQSPLEKNAIFKRDIDINPDTDKDAVYYYHAFTQQNKPSGEFMGPGMYGGPFATTSEFDGTFFNNSNDKVQLTFTKNQSQYTVSLEPHSFALLSSDKNIQNSIRSSSAAFTFKLPTKTISLPISATGLASVNTDKTTNQTITTPLTTRYEIYQNQVGIQGYNLGNYNQLGITNSVPQTSDKIPSAPTNIRDINPIPCSIWVQTAQDSTDPSLIPYQLPGTLWASYSSGDINLQQPLTSGGVTNMSIIRPQIAQTKSYFYIFSIDTTDTKLAQQFLTNVTTNTTFIKKIVPQTLKTLTLTNDQLNTLLSKATTQQAQNAFITDTKTGVRGTLLFIDTFVPFGGGQPVAPRYYKITPAALASGTSSLSFASIVTSVLDLTLFQGNNQAQLQAAQTEFWGYISDWLITFNKNKTKNIAPENMQANAQLLQNMVPDLTSYLKIKGLNVLFTNPHAGAPSRVFNQSGIRALYSILFGPLSLNNPPVLINPGVNAGIGGTKPDNWPA